MSMRGHLCTWYQSFSFCLRIFTFVTGPLHESELHTESGLLFNVCLLVRYLKIVVLTRKLTEQGNICQENILSPGLC